MKRATQRRNVVLQRHGRRALHHAGSRPTPPSRSRSSRAASRRSRRASRRSSSRKSASISRRQYGAKVLYENGLAVHDDARCDAAGARQPGARARPARATTSATAGGKPKRNVLAERHTIDGFKDERWNRPIAAGDVVPAVVVTAPKTGPARLRIGRYHADLEQGRLRLDAPHVGRGSVQAGRSRRGRRSRRSTRRPAPRRSRSIRRRSSKARIVAIENRTGQIKAMVGGWSFSRSKFNRAVQAYRQLGSTFKPIVYTAAIDRGFTPTSILIDAPVSYPAGNGRSTARTTTITSSRARSRCAGRSRSRATSRRSR